MASRPLRKPSMRCPSDTQSGTSSPLSSSHTKLIATARKLAPNRSKSRAKHATSIASSRSFAPKQSPPSLLSLSKMQDLLPNCYQLCVAVKWFSMTSMALSQTANHETDERTYCGYLFEPITASVETVSPRTRLRFLSLTDICGYYAAELHRLQLLRHQKLAA